MADVEFNWYGKKWEAAIVDRAAPKALSRVSSMVVQEAKRNSPVFLGNVRRSISFYINRTGELASYIGFSEGNADAWKYAMALERGRAAGSMPPSAPLIPWVIRKLGVPAKRAAGVAFVIARKIGERGTQARPFLIPAFDRHSPRLKVELVKIMEDIVSKELK